MKPVAFDYVRPDDVGGAIQALVANDNAKLIAGGQSLGPMLNLRLARPALLVDVSAIPELRNVEDLGDWWRIGAAITHAEIEDGRLPLADLGLLPFVARQIAYRAIRNRGTIGGSLAHADPAADWALALAACNAVVEVQGPRGRRQVGAADLASTAFTTVVADDEIIVSVRIPKSVGSARWGYFKLSRKVGEFPLASAVVVIDGRESRVFIGALADKPRPLAALALILSTNGTDIPGETLVEAIAKTAPEIDEIDRGIYVTCLARAIEQAFRV